MLILYKIFNLLSFLGMIAVNYVTIEGFGPFHSITNVSETYTSLITPPNWTFSIWGFIYLGLLCFNIFQFIPVCGLNNFVEKTKSLFILSNLFNAGWLLVYTLGTSISQICSVIIIFGLLTILLIIQSRVNFFDSESGCGQKTFGDIPFSLYLGWIMSASIVNVAGCINSFADLDENTQTGWYIFTLFAASILYSLNLCLKRNYVTSIVFLYVCIALLTKYINSTCFALTLTLAIVTLISVILKILIDCCKGHVEKQKNKKKVYISYSNESITNDYL